MFDKPAPEDQDLQRTLRLDVHLSRVGSASAWSGEVTVPGRTDRLSFPTLPALIAWIARLEPSRSARSIR